MQRRQKRQRTEEDRSRLSSSDLLKDHAGASMISRPEETRLRQLVKKNRREGVR